MTQKLRRLSFGGVIFSGTYLCNFMLYRKPETNNNFIFSKFPSNDHVSAGLKMKSY